MPCLLQSEWQTIGDPWSRVYPRELYTSLHNICLPLHDNDGDNSEGRHTRRIPLLPSTVLLGKIKTVTLIFIFIAYRWPALLKKVYRLRTAEEKGNAVGQGKVGEGQRRKNLRPCAWPDWIPQGDQDLSTWEGLWSRPLELWLTVRYKWLGKDIDENRNNLKSCSEAPMKSTILRATTLPDTPLSAPFRPGTRVEMCVQ